MARNDPQLIVRLPADLKAWLKEHAAANDRTQNAEVVHIIRSERSRCEDQPKAA